MKIIKLIPILLLLFLFSLPLSATIINVPADEATIQAGINIATNGDTVLVAEDTYNENINFNGKSITVASEYLLDSDNSHIDQTIIDGDNSGTVVTMDSGEDSNTVLCGFTIQNGDASGSYGGGIYLYQADPNLRNLIIKDNFATYEGGGIMCFESDPALEKVLISNNSTEARGGGLCAYYHSNPSLNKVTIVKNFANQEGSNIAFLSYSSVTMNNSIVWYWNITNSIYLAATVSFNATYSDIKNGSGEDFFGEGCIDADPLFADPDNNDFQLTWANMPTPDDTKSPCIDTGDPNTPNDPDATPADMGFYYYPQSGISGVVELNGGTGNVQNVSLEVEDSATDTTVATTNPDASGNYRFTLPGGIYDLHATLSGYESETIDNINVPDDQLVIQDTITLYAIQPGYIIGKVSKNDGAGQITSAEISAGGETVNPYPVTGPGGALLWYEYTLELPAGMYDVTASLAGYHDTTRTNVPVNPGDETENIDFELQLIIYESYIDGYVYEGKESPPS
ncbi:MAG: carboxypeptidase regulatory-like domain-containing protein, partial [Candidatus Cloacimonetes bacterium]|nr:carboxypeptidase regulatory-like domain-containing protein [Candidatus Cloacimonadota bacterium]